MKLLKLFRDEKFVLKADLGVVIIAFLGVIIMVFSNTQINFNGFRNYLIFFIFLPFYHIIKGVLGIFGSEIIEVGYGFRGDKIKGKFAQIIGFVHICLGAYLASLLI